MKTHKPKAEATGSAIGGYARVAAMTKDELVASSRRAAKARWAGKTVAERKAEFARGRSQGAPA